MKILRVLGIALAFVAVAAPVIAFAQAPQQGGVINIGQSLSPTLQPIVSDIVNAVIVAVGGWVVWWLKTKFNVDLDTKLRDGAVAFFERQAGSLIADGAVSLDGLKINVKSEKLAQAVNSALASIPDAKDRFGWNNAAIEQRIIDAIPKAPAVAGALSVAIDAANPATPSVAPPKA